MARKVSSDSRFASAFATLVCAWAVAMVVLCLGSTPRSAAGMAPSAAVTAAAIR